MGHLDNAVLPYTDKPVGKFVLPSYWCDFQQLAIVHKRGDGNLEVKHLPIGLLFDVRYREESLAKSLDFTIADGVEINFDTTTGIVMVTKPAAPNNQILVGAQLIL